jgi:hypothetical protein
VHPVPGGTQLDHHFVPGPRPESAPATNTNSLMPHNVARASDSPSGGRWRDASHGSWIKAP